jgi:hypothetical protein
VDDILAVSNDPQAIMDYLSKHYTLKRGSVKAPSEYLGCEIRSYTLDSGLEPVLSWSMSSDRYVMSAFTGGQNPPSSKHLMEAIFLLDGIVFLGYRDD